ncbi:unnamed protein product [Calicophoron daubneyi]|uniref:Cadherin domain-containing protein n=1 Tax=Calicophoron daubneyi TaxID=300641 RepID=A0AAV2TBX6_CALDB
MVYVPYVRGRRMIMLISTCLILLSVLKTLSAVSFVFPPGREKSYTGYLWKDASRVHLSPRLQANSSTDGQKSSEICGIRPYGTEKDALPFYIEVLDPKYGFADIRVKPTEKIDFQREITKVFQIEAYDCNKPPNFSERVSVTVHVVNRHGPVFDKPSYGFTISERSTIGSVLGHIQAIEETGVEEDQTSSAICNYYISPKEVPFTIDRYGVIRVREKLNPNRSFKPYLFQVVAEDCHRPTPRSASVDVMVEQIQQDCQPGWKGIPNTLEYRGRMDKPERLLWPFRMQLETCTSTCPESVIQARLELKSALTDYQLVTANPESCLHDPDHLVWQNRLCDIHPTTLRDLVPDPGRDIAAQLVGPSLGNPPRMTAPTRAWSFESAASSIWEVDPRYISPDSQQNAFDTDFTFSFWLRRQPGKRLPQEATYEDSEETVLCSQDQDQPNWRFLSVSFRGCNLIVRLMASFRYNLATVDGEVRKPTIWIFGPLPQQYCDVQGHQNGQWHHYAITFSRTPWASTSEMVSLLIDGKDLGPVGVPTETLLPSQPPFIPIERKAKPRITVGGCYDTNTKLSRQNLNGELAGLMLLIGRSESPNNLRCIAQCGESLVVPNVLKFLRSDINVNLESDAITVSGQNLDHVIDILRDIAYIRPQPDISPDYTANAAQSRILKLSTIYRCSPTKTVPIPPAEIRLNVLPAPNVSANEMRNSVESSERSLWIPQDTQIFDRPSIAQADMERKAFASIDDKDEENVIPSLQIIGSDMIITEPPIPSNGIPLFPDVYFSLPKNGKDELSNMDRVAAAVPIDGCMIWIASSGEPKNLIDRPGVKHTDGERIDWPIDKVLNLGVEGHMDRDGVRLEGQKPAEEYAKLLRGFHYWPPRAAVVPKTETPKPQKDKGAGGEGEINYVATVGLMCSMGAGKQNTQRFIVKIFIQSPDRNEDGKLMSDKVQKLAVFPTNGMNSAAQSKSDLERREMNDKLGGKPGLLLPVFDPQANGNAQKYSQRQQSVGAGAIVGIVICALVVVAVVVVAVFVYHAKRSPAPKRQPRHGGRRRFPAKPADFGGANLKQDPTLRLTANPMGEMEVGPSIPRLLTPATDISAHCSIYEHRT